MLDRYIKNLSVLTSEQQEKLLASKVCVIGCGGLGCFIVDELARAGILDITIADADTFSESNLNRQLYSAEEALGSSKVETAKKIIKSVNKDIKVNAQAKFLTEDNADEIIKDADIVIDALDNVETRFILEEACERQNKVLVHGAVGGLNGQITTVYPGDRSLGKIYKSEDGSNIEVSTMAFAAAIVASYEVQEAIKILSGVGAAFRNKLFLLDIESGTNIITDL